MPKIATLGSAKANASNRRSLGEDDRHHDLENINIMGNGPMSKKIWIYAGLALAAWWVYKNKSMV